MSTTHLLTRQFACWHVHKYIVTHCNSNVCLALFGFSFVHSSITIFQVNSWKNVYQIKTLSQQLKRWISNKKNSVIFFLSSNLKCWNSVWCRWLKLPETCYCMAQSELSPFVILDVAWQSHCNIRVHIVQLTPFHYDDTRLYQQMYLTPWFWFSDLVVL